MKIEFMRIKGLTQNSIATQIAEAAQKIIDSKGTIISITQYSDSSSLGRNKAGTIYYTR